MVTDKLSKKAFYSKIDYSLLRNAPIDIDLHVGFDVFLFSSQRANEAVRTRRAGLQ